MVSFPCLLILLAVVTYSVCGAPNWGTSDDFALRGAPKGSPSDRDDEYYYRRSRARGKGIGSLLLKNLRFRDLSDFRKNEGLGMLLNDYPAISHAETAHGVDKRQSVSISQLARLLNNLKARNVDEDGVKLQSLRFGKK